MSVKEERLMLFQMLEQGVVTVEDAQGLLAAIESQPPPAPGNVEVFIDKDGARHLTCGEIQAIIDRALAEAA
ncbi:MAG: hypothetical protein HYZ26_08330 [Chloroflexi bacterium]|nr:hypothetical protein [Chloroflexota bacterium]